MSTTATPLAVAATQKTVSTENGFERFIDKIKTTFVKAKPIADEALAIAQEAEPILALSPFGPEYDVVVNAISVAKAAGDASIAAGTGLTGVQKLGLAVQAASPALTTILASKGVSTNTQTHITNYVQTIYDLLSGPVAKIVATVTKAPAPATPTPAPAAPAIAAGVGQPA